LVAIPVPPHDRRPVEGWFRHRGRRYIDRVHL